MEDLLIQSKKLVQATPLGFSRYLKDQIHWDSRLIGILGARGTGKSTLLLQRIKEELEDPRNAIYLSLDDIYFTDNRLVDVARQLDQKGYTHLFIDEVHKYPGWSREIKNIHDFHPSLQIVFTGSSIIDVLQQEVDLSRRAVVYELPGLSFREFLNFQEGTDFKPVDLEDLLSDHESIASTLTQQTKPLQYFEQYLHHGYYPFFKEHLPTYHHQLNRIIRMVLESDLHFLEGISVGNIRKMNHLLFILAANVPFKPNISKLSERIGIHRNTLVQYLHFLEKARLINLLTKGGKSISHLSKPDKIFLENTNLAYALASQKVDQGTLRESFFLNQLKSTTQQVTLPKQGDFLVNNHYLFEVGGRNKSGRQIKDKPNSYIAADDLEIGVGKKIPLWLFGFLY